MKRLKTPLLSQRNQEWATVLLGYNTNPQYSIGMYGCLITCLAMYLGKTPLEVNTILKDNGGFTPGSGNFIWGKSTVLGLNQTYLSTKYVGPVTYQGILKIKELIDQGLPLLAEIDFNPATTGEEMHFVLITGYDDTSIYVSDPWTGTFINLDIYGGAQRAIIQFRAYDKKLELVLDAGQNTELTECLRIHGELVRELDGVKKELLHYTNFRDELSDALKCDNQLPAILGEIERVLSLEDDLLKVQKELEPLKNTVIEKENIIKGLEIANEDLKRKIAVYSDVEKANIELRKTIESLQKQLEKQPKCTIILALRNLVRKYG